MQLQYFRPAKATMLPVKVIISLIILAIMVLVFIGFLYQVIFASPAYRAFNDIYEQVNEVCAEPGDYAITFNIYMPDSSGTNKLNLKFFYIVVNAKKNKLELWQRSYSEEAKNDYLMNFVDWVRQEPGHKKLKERELKKCRGMEFCAEVKNKLDCDGFSFEPNEGKESIDITVSKMEPEDPNKLAMIKFGIDRDTICGDHRCCGDEDIAGDTYCEVDCDVTNPVCKVWTK